VATSAELWILPDGCYLVVADGRGRSSTTIFPLPPMQGGDVQTEVRRLRSTADRLEALDAKLVADAEVNTRTTSREPG
jgi:hypothetical protein